MQDVRSLPRSAVPPGAQRGVTLPLIVEGKVLGALVLYAGETGAFSAAVPDIAPVTMLADMLALALEAVRARALTRREASRHRARGAAAGRPQTVPRLEKPASYTLAGEGESQVGAKHSAPITVRGSVIGSMAFREREERALGPEEVKLIESVADQVGQAIENLGLLEEAQRVAQREQLINDITAQLQRATSVDEVLKTAAQAVRAALGDVEVTARLAPGAVASVAQAEAPGEGNGAE
jgi:GAF domain-containing protein